MPTSRIHRTPSCQRTSRFARPARRLAPPGAKRWHKNRFKELAEVILKSYSVQMLIFTEPDGYGIDLVVEGLIVVSGISLRQLIGLILFCNLFICNDGGPMHIAAALNVPTVAIFGPSNPDWFRPYGKKHRVVFKTTCPYHPCSEYCKFNSPMCMDNISVDDVMREVNDLLN